MSEKLKAYISFAQEDRLRVRELEASVRAADFETWFDEKDLTPGIAWMEEVRKAIPLADVFVSCVSTRSVSRPGFYDEEIGLALDLARNRPGFVIPVRLDDCELPAAYRQAQLRPLDAFGDAGFEPLIQALKQRQMRRSRAEAKAPSAASTTKYIGILHLSDLHFKEDDDHKELLNILCEDLEKRDIDYLVVSGDLSDRGNAVGYQNAEEFLTELQQRKSIPQERSILVPGNHDVQWDLGCFEIQDKIGKKADAVKVLVGNLETNLYLVRKGKSYADRFGRYAAVHKKITGQDYDLTDPGKQLSVVVSGAHRLQFLGLNSAWEIDQFRPKRASINSDAFESGNKLLRKNREYLGIAVWHHAITGNDKIKNDKFLGRLSDAGVRLCLHGDVHELRPDVVSPYSTSRIHIAGTGSFGATSDDRPASAPRMYNLIEVHEDHARARISTRQQPQPGMPFQTYATWSLPGQRDVRTGLYEFTLDPPAPSSTA